MDDMVRFNAYGNLDSCSNYEYESTLLENCEDIFDRWYELYELNCVDCFSNELKALLG